MLLLWIVALIAAVNSKINLRINKQLSAAETLTEEIYTISAQNLNDFNVKKMSFSFTNKFFEKLKIVKLYEGNNLVSTKMNFPSNYFTFNFEKTKKPDETFNIKIVAHYFQPFIFVPYKLTIMEDQKIEFTDTILNLEFDHEYSVEKVYGKYIFPNQVHSFSKAFIYNDLKNTYGERELVLNDIYPPFNDKKFKAHYTQDRSFETLTKAVKIVEISMWGNLKFDYDFRILNEAAVLDGELSNIDYQPHMTNSGKNSMKQNRLFLPRDIWRLSLTDEVGNLTRAIANYRNEQEIDLVIIPRFSLFGGWRSTYWITYNQWSKEYLFQSKQDSSLFKLETSFTHILGPILTKEYVWSFCLPEFATFKSVDIPYAPVRQETVRSYGLFEYFGKTCYVYEFSNVIEKVHKQKVSVLFEYNQKLIYVKLIYLISTLTILFALMFIGSRVDLSFERAQSKVKTE